MDASKANCTWPTWSQLIECPLKPALFAKWMSFRLLKHFKLSSTRHWVFIYMSSYEINPGIPFLYGRKSPHGSEFFDLPIMNGKALYAKKTNNGFPHQIREKKLLKAILGPCHIYVVESGELWKIRYTLKYTWRNCSTNYSSCQLSDSRELWKILGTAKLPE